MPLSIAMGNTQYIMDEAASNAHDMEKAFPGTKSVDEENRLKIIALPTPEVSFIRNGIVSNCMAHVILLEQTDLRRLRQQLEHAEHFYTHVRNHCKRLSQIPWKHRK